MALLMAAMPYNPRLRREPSCWEGWHNQTLTYRYVSKEDLTRKIKAVWKKMEKHRELARERLAIYITKDTLDALERLPKPTIPIGWRRSGDACRRSALRPGLAT